MKYCLYMIRSINICLAALLLTLPLRGQVISVLTQTDSLPGSGSEGIISDIYAASDTLQSQFLDWSSTLGDFADIKSVTEKELQRRIEARQQMQERRRKQVMIDGMLLNLPSVYDEEGADLFMLTEDGITIYMALLAPAYHQETTPDIIKWIRYYAYDNRERTRRMFERYEGWEAHIKNVFASYGVPEEIAELCMVESACTYTATSSAGAKGMWQIMPATARSWGLTVNMERDDRTDPVKSTLTAARILADNHRLVDDWTLSIAGYNCGMGRVTRVIKEKGTTDWLSVKSSFPKETQQYIPSLLAMHYIWNYRYQLALAKEGK